MQKFQPRHIYDVDGNERDSTEVAHQDDGADPNAGNYRVEGLQAIPVNHEKIGITDEQTLDEGFTVETSIVSKEIDKQNKFDEPHKADNEDDTIDEYMEVDNNELGFHHDAEDDD